MLKRKVFIGAGVAALALVVLPITAAAAGGVGWGAFGHPGRHFGHPAPGGAVVSIENGPYGPVLVVGGAGAGFMPATSTTPASYAYPAGTSLYLATIDPPTYGATSFHQYQPGCTTTVVSDTAEGALSCTGTELDPSADWPAFTTNGFPIAGRGVNPSLLSAVYRPDLGTFQVTYAGHPLYLFDPGPDSFFGANFYESALPLPPWNTAWYLVTPWGTPASGPASLQTEAPQAGTTYNSTELAAVMLPNAVPGGAAVSAYTFSGDRPNFSVCYDACAREFIPLSTVGAPTLGAGVNTSEVGVIHRFDGTEQVTYDGHPLYLYDAEQPLAGSGGLITNGSAGNGNGVSGFGGTLNLITP
jgi:predicted lipoprotein with Yx(FWY)xxD motif